MKRLLILPLLFLVLSAGMCTVPHAACPPLKAYDKAFLNALADEVESVMDTKPHVVKVIKDYGITRDQIRACMKR